MSGETRSLCSAFYQRGLFGNMVTCDYQMVAVSVAASIPPPSILLRERERAGGGDGGQASFWTPEWEASFPETSRIPPLHLLAKMGHVLIPELITIARGLVAFY